MSKFVNTIDANGFKVINLANGVSPQDAVTLSQLNAAVQGYSWKQPVRAATTANITLSGVQTIDSVSVIAGDRVLVKNQTTASANGIYVVASGSWTRALDMDIAAEFLLATTFVSEGGQGNSGWTMTTDAPIVVDTTLLVFTQTSGNQLYTAGNGITISTGVISVDTTVTARKAAATIGDGVATTVTFTHNLNSQDISVSVKEVSTNSGIAYFDWIANGVNTVQLTFGSPPSTGQFRVVVVA